MKGVTKRTREPVVPIDLSVARTWEFSDSDISVIYSFFADSCLEFEFSGMLTSTNILSFFEQLHLIWEELQFDQKPMRILIGKMASSSSMTHRTRKMFITQYNLFNQTHRFEAYLFYNVAAPIYFLRGLMRRLIPDLNRVSLFRTRQQALETVVSLLDKASLSQTHRGASALKNSSGLQFYSGQLLDFLGRVNWEVNQPMQETIPENHPMKRVYEAILDLKSDFERVFQDKLRTEMEINRQNQFNGIRAEIWRLASDRTLSTEHLIQSILSYIGPQLSLSRASFFPAVDIRSYEMICQLEWRFPTLKPGIGVRFPNIYKYCNPTDYTILSQESALSLFPKGEMIKLIPFDVMYGIMSSLINPIYYNNEFIGVFLFSVGHEVGGQFDWSPELITVIQEITMIAANRLMQEKAEQDIQTAYNVLEQKVKDRTKDLEVANRVLKLASEKAEESSRTKSDFLARISHDIRTPLTVILGLSEIILTSQDVPANQKQSEIILNESRRMRDLINELLDLSKIEAGKMALDLEPVELPSLLNQLLVAFQIKAVEKHLEFRTNLSPEVAPVILADAMRLNQILINLISNALKFTREGYVRLSVSQVSRDTFSTTLRFDVEDSGIGIEEAQLATIFESYKQANQTKQSEFGGAGLGTAIARQLVELMGGTIGVTSEVGKGSIFWFICKFPLPQSTAMEPRKSGAVSAADSRFSSTRILLVEDYPATQIFVSQLLAQLGCVVEVAENGAIGVEKVTNQHFDLVLMDLKMPVMDGYAATIAIRQQLLNVELPIVAMSANAFEEDKRRCLEIGMNGFIAKPMEKQDLIRILSQFVLHAVQD